MKTLITGGDGKFATQLQKYIDGDYFGKDRLDLSNIQHIQNLTNYDCIIHTATGSPSINKFILLLLEKGKKNFIFTSKQGTFLNWKKQGNMLYGIEKLVLNFMVYRFNMEKQNCQLVEPGHMETTNEYDQKAKKFKQYLDQWKYTKNMIYDIEKDQYLAY